MTGIADCCARAASGHAAVTLPINLINSRRLIAVIRHERTGHTKHSTWKGFAYVRFGSKADMCSALGDVRYVPKADSCTAAIDASDYCA